MSRRNKDRRAQALAALTATRGPAPDRGGEAGLDDPRVDHDEATEVRDGRPGQPEGMDHELGEDMDGEGGEDMDGEGGEATDGEPQPRSGRAATERMAARRAAAAQAPSQRSARVPAFRAPGSPAPKSRAPASRTRVSRAGGSPAPAADPAEPATEVPDRATRQTRQTRPPRPARDQGDRKTAALVAAGVTKDYGDLVALDNFSVKVTKGQRVVVVGPNGSGKTTFIRVAAGLLEPSDGELRIMGAVAGSLEARSVTAYISDNPVLYDDLSVIEHLEYVARLHGAGDWVDRGWEVLERLGLDARADDLPSRFSRGLRQKTAIALGLCRPFSVLLVDEPFVGLDAPGKAALLELLDEEADRGASIIIATHSLDFVAQADRCLGLRDGQLSYDGPATTGTVQRLVGA